MTIVWFLFIVTVTGQGADVEARRYESLKECNAWQERAAGRADTFAVCEPRLDA
jgi:hypothetical protein